jgi:hypothetical protein
MDSPLFLPISIVRRGRVIICKTVVSYQLSVKAHRVRVEASHPFARKKAKGWGTVDWWEIRSGQLGSCYPRYENPDLGYPHCCKSETTMGLHFSHAKRVAI